MKAESMDKPVASFEVTFLKDDNIFIEFFRDIVSKEREENDEKLEYFEYDYYTLKIKNREGIIEELKNNEDKWLQIAKNKEISSKETKLDVLKQNIIDFSLEKQILESTGYFSSSSVENKLQKAIQEHSLLAEEIVKEIMKN